MEGKVKVSELNECTDFNGLYTLGVDSNNNSVKVPLQKVGEAANNAEEAARNATEITDAIRKDLEEGKFNGSDGADGADGYTPVKGVDYFDGKDGKDGEDGKDGKDGSILFPSMRVDAAGYLVCDVPDASEGTNFDIDGEGYLCVDFPDVE